MRTPERRGSRRRAICAFLVLITLAFASGACCSAQVKDQGEVIPPYLICRQRPQPPDPLKGTHIDDGFTPAQRAAYIRRAVASTVTVRVDRYTRAHGINAYGGTGTVIGPDHMILTAYHVVQDAEFVTVTYRYLKDDGLTVLPGRTVPVNIIAVSKKYDVAILRPVHMDEPKFPPVLPVDMAWRPKKYELVWQFGATTRWSRGRVTGNVDEKVGPTPHMTEVDFTVQPGDSGGPALSPDGKVIGVILRYDAGDTSTRADDKGYFLPVYIALRVLHYRP